MKIYLVRHGESESNAKGVRLGPVARLTDKGKEQASFLANRFENIPIDKVVSSSYIRAIETTEIINQKLGKEIIQSDLLVERKNSTETIGLANSDPLMQEVIKQSNLHLDDPNWHYSDEENFHDQKERALKALDFLKNLGGENILVVSHGVFSRMMVSCAIFGSDLDLKTYWQIMSSLKTSNTGITILETNDSSSQIGKKTDWSLITWNDHAHLGEIRQYGQSY